MKNSLSGRYSLLVLVKIKQIFVNGVMLVVTLLQFNSIKLLPLQKAEMLEINVKIIEKPVKIEKLKAGGCDFRINAHVKNLSDTSISFWVMSCSWGTNWILDNKNVGLYSKECDSNFPRLIDLKSKEEVKFEGTIRTTDSTIKTCRMGFVLVAKQEFSGSGHNYWPIIKMKKEKKKDIFWSDTINFIY